MKPVAFSELTRYLLNEAIKADAQMQLNQNQLWKDLVADKDILYNKHGEKKPWFNEVANTNYFYSEASGKYLSLHDISFRFFITTGSIGLFRRILYWFKGIDYRFLYSIDSSDKTKAIEVKISVHRRADDRFVTKTCTNPQTDLTQAYVVG